MICACVLGAVVSVAAWLFNQGPHVNLVQAAAMLPVIDTYLDQNSGMLEFGDLSTVLKPREFCDAHIIEIRPDGSEWHVGLVMNCGEFARRGTTLIEGTSGYPGIAEVMMLAGDPGSYRALSLQVGPPYYDVSWVDSHFSPSAAAVILGTNPPTAPDPIGQAWRAFGFPAGTPAVQE